MDSIALQLAVRYATKSGKMSLAQKITDELIEQKKDQEEKQKEIQRSASPTPPPRVTTSSTISFTSSVFEPIKTNQTKAPPSSAPFSNPFRKKNVTTTTSNDASASDELSKWKPSISKSRLATSNKPATTPQVEFQCFVFNQKSICYLFRMMFNLRWLTWKMRRVH